MAVLSLSTATPKLNRRSLSHASSLLYFAASLLQSPAPAGRISCRTRVTSSHSNPKILKSNRRSRHGQPLSPYDTDDDTISSGSDELNDDWHSDVFSLSLEGNLKPKYMYLINELQNEVHSLTKYPTYLSLSLDQRIRPRHRFLVSLKKAPKGPFPLSSFVPTDECFCRQWAGTSVDKYLDFRQRLLLKSLAKKYERQ